MDYENLNLKKKDNDALNTGIRHSELIVRYLPFIIGHIPQQPMPPLLIN